MHCNFLFISNCTHANVDQPTKLEIINSQFDTDSFFQAAKSLFIFDLDIFSHLSEEYVR